MRAYVRYVVINQYTVDTDADLNFSYKTSTRRVVVVVVVGFIFIYLFIFFFLKVVVKRIIAAFRNDEQKKKNRVRFSRVARARYNM